MNKTQARTFQGVIGEIVPAHSPSYDPMTERALDDLGDIFRTWRGMSVEQAENLFRQVRCDAQMQAQVIAVAARHAQEMERLETIKAKIGAGAYRPDGEEIAACMLTYPQWRDYDRRRDYHAERFRREDFREEAGMDAARHTEEGGAWCDSDQKAFHGVTWLLALSATLMGCIALGAIVWALSLMGGR